VNKPADIQLRSFLGKRNFAIDTIQSDGKILVSGSWAGCFTVVRYRADGSAVDPNFGAPTVGPNAAQVCFQPLVGMHLQWPLILETRSLSLVIGT